MKPDAPDPAGATGRGIGTGILLAGLLFLGFFLRIQGLDQVIVENYVGRQIPTAMVARNLERGSGFLRPQLDTGPFPNLFLVEPPVYEQLVVWVKRITGLGLEESGRLLSAFGMTLAAWGLFGLARRREGNAAAILSVLAFSAFPVTIRYGRSFQPDALMLGLMILGLSRCDRIGVATSRRAWAEGVAGWLLLASGLALKITSGYLLAPLIVCLSRLGWRLKLLFAATTLLPALAWYGWANSLVNSGQGSLASADNRTIWLQVLAPTALFSASTWGFVGRFVFWRCFTPMGPILALGGFVSVSGRGIRDRFWQIWGASATLALIVLAAKVHHEYYWLALAPIMAVGVGRWLCEIHRRLSGAGGFTAGVFLGLCGFQAMPTWETPPEWRHLAEAGLVVGSLVPADALVVAPEALLFQGDRRGCRLEFSPRGCRRAAGEWGERLALDDAENLVEMYRTRGARYLADMGAARGGDAEREALHQAIRRRYKVIVDQPAIFLADLRDSRHPG